MPGRRRDEQLDRAILAAADTVLANGGYYGFSIDGVAKELDIPRSTIYKRWRNRADLLDGILAVAFDRTNTPTSDVHADLTTLLHDDLELIASTRGRAAAHLLLTSADSNGPPADRLTASLTARRAEYLTRLADAGLAHTTTTEMLDLVLTGLWGRAVITRTGTTGDPHTLATMIVAPPSEPASGGRSPR